MVKSPSMSTLRVALRTACQMSRIAYPVPPGRTADPHRRNDARPDRSCQQLLSTSCSVSMAGPAEMRRAPCRFSRGAARRTVGDRKFWDHAVAVVWQQEIRLLFAFDPWREAICWSLAAAMGVSQARMSRLEKGELKPAPSPPTSKLLGASSRSPPTFGDETYVLGPQSNSFARAYGSIWRVGCSSGAIRIERRIDILRQSRHPLTGTLTDNCPGLALAELTIS